VAASNAKRTAVARTQRGARYGSGSLVKRAGPNGDTWIAKWRDGGRQVQRGLGFVHSQRHPEGLTRAEAEGTLAKLRDRVAVERAEQEREAEKRLAEEQRRTLGQVGEALIAAKRDAGRKRSTIEAYSYWLRIHIVDYFGPMSVSEITREDVRGFAAALERKGLAPKSRANALGSLHSLIEFAIDEGWAVGENPVKRVRKPALAATDPDIRFLDTEELEALLRAVPSDPLGRVESVMYLAAAMTGMRQGELFALRWRDVDWIAGRVRVRRNYVRGEFGTPKSKRSSRSIPLARRIAAELDMLFRDSGFTGDDDLVFAHPLTGKPIDRSKLLKRFKAALRRAGVREVRFHDLRHTFGTRMAAQGVPMRVLQELLGHRDFKTTLIYADYAPSEREAEWVEKAFRPLASDTIGSTPRAGRAAALS
jgi:integrase